MTQNRPIPYRDGILGNDWIKWFKNRHLNILLRIINHWMWQGLRA